MRQRPDNVRFFIAQGADVNAKDERGDTPLHEAVLHTTDTEVLKFLVASGADVNVKNKRGTTPLHRAVRPHCPCEDTDWCSIKLGDDGNVDDEYLDSLFFTSATSFYQYRGANSARYLRCREYKKHVREPDIAYRGGVELSIQRGRRRSVLDRSGCRGERKKRRMTGPLFRSITSRRRRFARCYKNFPFKMRGVRS